MRDALERMRGEGEVRALIGCVQLLPTCHGAETNFRDLTPVFTHGRSGTGAERGVCPCADGKSKCDAKDKQQVLCHRVYLPTVSVQ